MLISAFVHTVLINNSTLFSAIIGEVDETMDSSIDLSAIRAEPIGSVVF